MQTGQPNYTEQRDADIQKIRDQLLAANLYSEIPEKNRTPEQQQILTEAMDFLRNNGLDVFDLLAKPLFEDIRFETHDETADRMFVRWGQTLEKCYPPRLPQSTPNAGEFEQLFMELYSGQNSVGGVYEEARAMLENFERAIDHAERVCGAVWNFDKVTKTKPVFAAMVPDDIERTIRRIAMFLERARKRWAAFEASFNTLVQIKNINLGTPSQPYRMTETNTATAAPTQRPAMPARPEMPASAGSSDFKGGHRPATRGGSRALNS